MRVRDLARKLDLDEKNIRQELAKLGVRLPPKANKIDNRMAHSIITKVERVRREEAARAKKAAEREARKQDETLTAVLPPYMTVKEFAKRLELPVTEAITELMKQGMLASVNESIDYEIAAIVAEELGYAVEKGETESEKKTSMQLRDELKEEVEKGSDKDSELIDRPPIVTIMGHVDHGKTTLLDAIRETNVVEGESGGITQSIGAYQVEHDGRPVTFIDTPGHEAFSAMRARGANVTDIAVLVVAADDGVRPQTKESKRLAEAAGVPIVVAINKIDKPEANIDKIKAELGDLGLTPEEWGGETMMVPISAKQGKGIDELVEAILVVTDAYEFKGSASRNAVGTVIESHLDNKVGPVATVIVQGGELSVGDMVLVGSQQGKVKALWNHKEENVKSAGLSEPVRILGLSDVPEAGDVLEVFDDVKELKTSARQLQSAERQQRIQRTQAMRSGTDSSEDGEDGVPRYNIVLRADVQGSLEAITQTLLAMPTDVVEFRVLDAATGDVSESDVSLAMTSDAVILGFNVGHSSIAKQMADQEEVIIKEFSVIYELIDFIKQDATRRLPEKILREKVGVMKVLAVFKTSPGEMIIGGRVEDGKLILNGKAIVEREGEEFGEGDIVSLQESKVDVKEVEAGKECGLTFSGSVRIKEGDVLQVFEERVVTQQID